MTQPMPNPSDIKPRRPEMKFQEFNGASAEDAEQKARESLGSRLIGIEVVREVQQLSASAQAMERKAALEAAAKRVPEVAIQRQPPVIIQESRSGEAEVQEFEEREARKAWRRTAPRGAQIDSLECAVPPRNGMLGVGKRPGTWTIQWSSPFVAEAAYTMPAVVKATYFG